MLAYFVPLDRSLSRRALLAGMLALTGCARRRSRGFPGYAFVANAGGRTVAAVDLNSFVLAKQIGLDGSPSAVLANPLRPGAYVLIPESGTVCEIDAVKLTAARKTSLKNAALGMRLAADGKSLWVLEARALARLELTHLRAAEEIRLPGAATDFDLTGDGRAAVCFGADRRLALVRLGTGKVEHLIDAECEPSLVRFQGDGQQVLVGSRADRCLSIFDAASGRIAVRLPLPVEPANCCFNSDGGQMFLTGPGMDAVVIVYPYQTEVGETILAGRMPEGMAVCGTPQYLFVANPETGSVTVLDIETRKLAAVLAVGQDPRRILITPDNRYALVLNQRSGNMAVIRIAAFAERRRRTDPAPLFTMVPVGVQPVAAAVVAVG
ncbi:MAG TPA: YncE family protein [Bryobacteraceae bacterium]|nr:YncE family protein [Bryobacteraceae bacterium]